MDEYFEYGKASVLIDGQFGSTGKGLAAAHIYSKCKDVDWTRVACVTNAAPNAGHTTVTADGRKFVTFHMPTIGVLAPDTHIVLNAGAIIDIELLVKEVKELGVDPARVFIHPNAAVITDEDHEAEKQKSSSQTSIASTQKGVGAALANKVSRRGKVAKDYYDMLRSHGFWMFDADINRLMDKGFAVSIETPQGMSLSLNNSFYPYCTSREVSVAQSLSDAAVNPRLLNKVMMTMRTFPIRVGNIVDENGLTIGWSGPVYPDQREMTWADFPNVEPERTTVTKRVRRIFTFSETQYEESLRRLAPDYVHVGFCDYFPKQVDFESFINITDSVERRCNAKVQKQFAFGPSVTDIYDLEGARKQWQGR